MSHLLSKIVNSLLPVAESEEEAISSKKIKGEDKAFKYKQKGAGEAKSEGLGEGCPGQRQN